MPQAHTDSLELWWLPNGFERRAELAMFLQPRTLATTTGCPIPSDRALRKIVQNSRAILEWAERLHPNSAARCQVTHHELVLRARVCRFIRKHLPQAKRSGEASELAWLYGQQMVEFHAMLDTPTSRWLNSYKAHFSALRGETDHAA